MKLLLNEMSSTDGGDIGEYRWKSNYDFFDAIRYRIQNYVYFRSVQLQYTPPRYCNPKYILAYLHFFAQIVLVCGGGGVRWGMGKFFHTFFILSANDETDAAAVAAATSAAAAATAQIH